MKRKNESKLFAALNRSQLRELIAKLRLFESMMYEGEFEFDTYISLDPSNNTIGVNQEDNRGDDEIIEVQTVEEDA